MVEYVDQTGITVQGNGHADISPGFGLGFPAIGDIVLCIACTSGAVGYDFETADWNELMVHQFDAGVDLALGVWYTLYSPFTWHGPPVIGVDSWTQKTEFCMMIHFTGNDYRDPLDVVNAPDMDTDAAVIGPIDGLTPTAPGAGVVAIGIRRDGFASDIDTLSGDLDWTELVDHESTIGDFSLALAVDFATDEEGGTAVASKTFTQTGGNDANWLGFMFSINPVLNPSRVGWPHPLSDPPADGQGWPRA